MNKTHEKFTFGKSNKRTVEMCSLEEAFPTIDQADMNVEYKSSKKRTKGRRTLLPPPEEGPIDPDRLSKRPIPPERLVGSKIEFSQSDSPLLSSNSFGSAGSSFATAPDPDYVNPKEYMLEGPDWAKFFNDSSTPEWLRSRIPLRNTEHSNIIQPWFDGSPTLYEEIPKNWRSGERRDAQKYDDFQSSKLDELQMKIDNLFSRLEERDSARSEANHTEVILFVLGGLFLLLLLDLIVKQGTNASLLIAAAGGGSNTIAQAFLKGGYRNITLRK
jgi:hypothetical protein